ncbi:hypothetical protein J4526_01895 [Desulfurococcaceae archaeon MEX13E-LK6-19]|nr:hypothetical protein J4526_01895 [Desulfurococcaceae archaeon MEX13E-LK6-19]
MSINDIISFLTSREAANIAQVFAALATIIIAFAAYKQIRAIRFGYERRIALDLAAAIACVLAYMKKEYGLIYPGLESVTVRKCSGKESLIGEEHVTYLLILDQKMWLLSKALRDKEVKKILPIHPIDKTLFCQDKETCLKIAQRYFGILASTFNYLVKEYRLSFSEIEKRCKNLAYFEKLKKGIHY